MTQSSEKIWGINSDKKGDKNISFFSTENNKYGVYYFDINEYGFSKLVSPVQVWSDIHNPKLLFDSGRLQSGQKHFSFEYQNSSSCYYLELSDILVLLGNCFDQTEFELFYILFDFNKYQFAILRTANFIPIELAKDEIRLDIHFRYYYDQDIKEKILKDDGKVLSLKNFEWHDIDEINKVCLLMNKNNR